jgi:hypothetical protein
MGHVRDMSSSYVWHFCQVFLKSLKSYWVDTTTSALSGIMTLSSKCEVDLQATDLDLFRDSSSSCVRHFCQVILKSPKKWQSYWADTTTSALSGIMTLRIKSDLNLQAKDLGLVRDSSSSCVRHFCQVILKSHRVTYWADMTTISGNITLSS